MREAAGAIERIRNACEWSPYAVRMVWSVVLVGGFLRTCAYLCAGPLWLDEYQLAWNLRTRSFAGLLSPLGLHENAPIGFLLVEKAMIVVFGDHPLVFRLFPFIASLCSLPLFYLVGRQRFTPRGTLIGLALFALSRFTIHFASELRPYAGDVTVALGLILGGLYVVGTGGRRAALVLAALSGAVAVWFSYPAIFLLVGCGAALILDAWQREGSRGLLRTAPLICCWSLSFLIQFLLVGGHATHDTVQQWSWRSAFAPLPVRPAAIGWYVALPFETFKDPVGFDWAAPAFVVYLIGIVTLYRWDRRLLLILALPILAALTASLFHLYPFQDRLLLFAVPLVLLTMAMGLQWALLHHNRNIRLLGWGVYLILMLRPAVVAVDTLLHPMDRSGAGRFIRYSLLPSGHTNLRRGRYSLA